MKWKKKRLKNAIHSSKRSDDEWKICNVVSCCLLSIYTSIIHTLQHLCKAATERTAGANERGNQWATVWLCWADLFIGRNFGYWYIFGNFGCFSRSQLKLTDVQRHFWRVFIWIFLLIHTSNSNTSQWKFGILKLDGGPSSINIF